MLKRLATIALLGFLAACHGSSSPTDPSVSEPRGRLSGTVTIGPNCPVTTTASCPTPPLAYQQRKILVYDEPKARLLHTVDIDNQGLYTILLIPATYTIDLKGVGIDRTSDLPKTVTIHANVATVVNVNVDTGLR